MSVFFLSNKANLCIKLKGQNSKIVLIGSLHGTFLLPRGKHTTMWHNHRHLVDLYLFFLLGSILFRGLNHDTWQKKVTFLVLLVHLVGPKGRPIN